MSCIDYSGLCFVVTLNDKSYGYRHRRILVNSNGGGGQGARSPWVLGTLIYEGVKKRWKTDLNQSQYAYTTFPPLPTNLCAPLQLCSKKKLFVCRKIFGAASVPRPLPSLVTPMATARNKTGAFYLILYASDYKLLNRI